jgi:hypothetical protein
VIMNLHIIWFYSTAFVLFVCLFVCYFFFFNPFSQSLLTHGGNAIARSELVDYLNIIFVA